MNARASSTPGVSTGMVRFQTDVPPSRGKNDSVARAEDAMTAPECTTAVTEQARPVTYSWATGRRPSSLVSASTAARASAGLRT